MLNKIFKKKTSKFVPKDYVLLNVEIFNSWFNDPNNEAIYANPGIFLRIDKLSIGHITDYFIKCHGFESEEEIYSIISYDKIYEFQNKIINDWKNKIQGKSYTLTHEDIISTGDWVEVEHNSDFYVYNWKHLKKDVHGYTYYMILFSEGKINISVEYSNGKNSTVLNGCVKNIKDINHIKEIIFT